MLGNFNIEILLTFPLKDTEARKNFLIGALVCLAIFIIPILPLIFLTGYTARIMRQVVNGEAPRLPAWDDWEAMLKDGALLFGVRMVYALPLLALMTPIFIGFIFLPDWLPNLNSNEALVIIPFAIFGIMMLFIFPISLAMGIIIPAAEIHTAVHGDFAAGFRVREWWPIFRSNWTGFLLAYMISMVAAIALTIIVQVAMMTIILICILPLVIPGITAYITFVMYAAFAQAYKEGNARFIAQPS